MPTYENYIQSSSLHCFGHEYTYYVTKKVENLLHIFDEKIGKYISTRLFAAVLKISWPVERLGMVEKGGDDGLEHRFLHSRAHAAYVVHDGVEQQDVQIGALQVGPVLLRVQL